MNSAKTALVAPPSRPCSARTAPTDGSSPITAWMGGRSEPRLALATRTVLGRVENTHPIPVRARRIRTPRTCVRIPIHREIMHRRVGVRRPRMCGRSGKGVNKVSRTKYFTPNRSNPKSIANECTCTNRKGGLKVQHRSKSAAIKWIVRKARKHRGTFSFYRCPTQPGIWHVRTGK